MSSLRSRLRLFVLLTCSPSANLEKTARRRPRLPSLARLPACRAPQTDPREKRWQILSLPLCTPLLRVSLPVKDLVFLQTGEEEEERTNRRKFAFQRAASCCCWSRLRRLWSTKLTDTVKAPQLLFCSSLGSPVRSSVSVSISSSLLSTAGQLDPQRRPEKRLLRVAHLGTPFQFLRPRQFPGHAREDTGRSLWRRGPARRPSTPFTSTPTSRCVLTRPLPTALPRPVAFASPFLFRMRLLLSTNACRARSSAQFKPPPHSAPTAASSPLHRVYGQLRSCWLRGARGRWRPLRC
ncbi:hypothetical protein TGRH88_064320 [Toxoplasma gondii]|uniref:Uncharacterized protein n=1 Tax=Toxoplasma gondii TaxID=5811 RepID=A0A7J6JUF9_TOXGO|nr:hypothetical protein TGRH88_064320 [Toxoplasma gondii]